MIGIDIVSIQRFEKFLDKFGDKALKRFLNQDEISLVNSTQSYAGLFAAKEAVSKALGTGIGSECSFDDIIIHKDDKKAPYFTLSKKIIDKYDIKESSLSITHDGGFAIAVVSISSDLKQNKPICH
jgi:holo-[acyl-carrier protein] synthase